MFVCRYVKFFFVWFKKWLVKFSVFIDDWFERVFVVLNGGEIEF